jgi:crotonobetainyl-CoA:carnitine CoA-transferase CaiB-like acyl-CoA transferase
VYRTSDGYLCVAALNRSLREKLCTALEIHDEHVQVDLGGSSDRAYHDQKALMHAIEDRLLQHPNAYWQELLEAAGVPCGPVNYRANLYEDPQVQALGMMWQLQNRELGSYKVPGHPVRFSKTPVRATSGAPALGEHSEAILLEIGYTLEEIAGLKQAGIVR